MSDMNRCRGLEEMFGRIFRPAQKPKTAPKKLYRVGWFKPVPGSENWKYGKTAHSYKRFETESEAVAFAAEHDARAEVWRAGRWNWVVTADDKARHDRLRARAAERRASVT